MGCSYLGRFHRKEIQAEAGDEQDLTRGKKKCQGNEKLPGRGKRLKDCIAKPPNWTGQMIQVGEGHGQFCKANLDL